MKTTIQKFFRNASGVAMLLIATTSMGQGWKGEAEPSVPMGDDQRYADNRETSGPSSASGAEQDFQMSAKVYPTVTRGEFTVRFENPEPGEVEVEVYDILGKKIWSAREWSEQGTYTGDFSGDLKGCGTYIVRVTRGALSFTRKIHSPC